MRNKRYPSSSWLILLGLGLLLPVLSNVALAEPFLQLDFANGYYDPETESIFSSSNSATLYALVNSKKKSFKKVDTYFIVASIIPKQDNVEQDFGSFEFNGETYDVTSDLDYGNPMRQDHGIFPTFYKEFSFGISKDDDPTAALYNSQDTPGGLDSSSDGPMYYKAFAVDVGGMTHAYGLHFDLYTKDPYKFAPFSHDAVAAPVPGAFLLGGIGLGISALKLRRKGRKD